MSIVSLVVVQRWNNPALPLLFADMAGCDQGIFTALDANTGKPLWHFPTSELWKASPMTYVFDHKQYVAIASGSNILAFGLGE